MADSPIKNTDSYSASKYFCCFLFCLIFPVCSVYGQSSETENDDFLEIGGALRFNLYYTDYESSPTANSLQFTFDTWRINVAAQKAGVGLNFEYRFYPTFNTHFIKQGWFEYNVSDKIQLQLGVTQVPFGNLQYNSHNWWFQGPYYVGLEDDHDMGLKLIYDIGEWNMMVAWFLQPEPSGPAYGTASFGVGGPGRYSYDIIPITGNNPWDYVLDDDEIPQSNQEKNQLNIRLVRNFAHSGGITEAGASLMYGNIYNSALDEMSDRVALAAHLDGTYGKINIKAQYIYFRYTAYNDSGEQTNYVYMGAYGDPYSVASEMNMYSLGISWSEDVNFAPVSNIMVYNNYTFFQKPNSVFNHSHQNVLGALFTLGDVFIYFDVASGLNHPWLTDNFGTGMAAGVDNPRLNTRFNINIGYYF